MSTFTHESFLNPQHNVIDCTTAALDNCDGKVNELLVLTSIGQMSLLERIMHKPYTLEA